MHLGLLANIVLSAACLVWLAVSAYYLFYSSQKQPKVTKKISIAFAFHGTLIAALILTSMLSLPSFTELLNLNPTLPQTISGIAALSLGLLSVSWFLPKALPNYSKRERELEVSLSDTTSHLKSLYSLSQQGVMLVYADSFDIQQANTEAKRVLDLTSPNNDELVLHQALQDYLSQWLKQGRTSTLLTLPTEQGSLTLKIDISSFAMKRSTVLLIQFKEIENVSDQVQPYQHQDASFEVQLIERFDELLNLQAHSASELMTLLASRLIELDLFNYISLLENDHKSETAHVRLFSEGHQHPKQVIPKSAFDDQILNPENDIQLYSGPSEIKLPKEISTLIDSDGAITVVNFNDPLSNQFTLVLNTRHTGKLNSAILALVEQLKTQICYRLNQLNQDSIQKQHALMKKQLTTIIESSANAIILTNTEFMIEYVNPKLCQTSGYQEEQLIGRPFSVLCPIEDNPLIHRSIRDHVNANQPWYGEVVQRDMKGNLQWSNLQLSFMQDEQGKVSHFIMHIEDRTELYLAQDEINQLTHFDPLTNLPNRNLLTLRTTAAIEENPNKQMIALMYLDLDGFKHINDSLGHQNGDRLLKQIAERLSEHLAPEDTLARLGGDEFALLIPNVLAKGSLITLVNNILNTISLPTIIAENTVVLTGSIGITLFPQDTESTEELQRNADLAMYQAKKEQGNSYHIYTPDLNQQAVTRLDMEHRLRQAIHNEELEVHFQPQVDITSGDIIGAEALLRWNDPERGAISPAQFIPLAEETGLIDELGNWVLHQACNITRQFIAHVKGPFKVAINLSAYQFKRQDQLIQELESALHNNQLPAECIELELTESMLMENVQTTKDTLQRLHDKGFSIAIDDFGTGYSSLAYLKEFPIDKLKIDRSFIKDVNRNQDDAAITSAVIAMAHKLGLNVLAEGVENSSQLQFLINHQCNYIQGFYFSKAVSTEEFIDLLQKEEKSPDLLKKLN